MKSWKDVWQNPWALRQKKSPFIPFLFWLVQVYKMCRLIGTYMQHTEINLSFGCAAITCRLQCSRVCTLKIELTTLPSLKLLGQRTKIICPDPRWTSTNMKTFKDLQCSFINCYWWWRLHRIVTTYASNSLHGLDFVQPPLALRIPELFLTISCYTLRDSSCPLEYLVQCLQMSTTQRSKSYIWREKK